MKKETYKAIRAEITEQIAALTRSLKTRKKLTESEKATLEDRIKTLKAGRQKLIEDYERIQLDFLVKKADSITNDLTDESRYNACLNEVEKTITSIYDLD